MKKILSLFFILLVLRLPTPVFASSNAFVSIVNPVRGGDFWSLKNQKPEDSFIGESEILKQSSVQATWLIRFDAFNNKEIMTQLDKLFSDEKGLFLEITPSWTQESGVTYHQSENWHNAGTAFLSGYEREEREKLIDTAFNKFKLKFNTFPKSVGAWWIDSYSLNYMQTKYKVTSALIVADQYTTDNYQIWGQYWSSPYYPAKNNILHPAQSLENKLPIVITQWAARDPVNGYGNGVLESTYSVQANDYLDYHNLDTNYFEKLIDIYTKQKFNKFGQVVVGLENSYEWNKYATEYENQIKRLSEKRKKREIELISLSDFSNWYRQNFPDLSPSQIIIADDPLGKDKKVVWFMNPFYRSGWFYNEVGSIFRDIRQYTDGQQELCFQKRCESVNFATSATRVLDEVSFGHKWVIDQGKLSNFRVSQNGEKYVINYSNEALNIRTIEFLPRDIGLDGKISSIDTTILNAIKADANNKNSLKVFEKGKYNWNIVEIIITTIKFMIFLILLCLIPGLNAINKLIDQRSLGKRIFFAISFGLVSLTITFYILSILNLRFLIYLYPFIHLFIFLKFKLIQTIKISYLETKKWQRFSLVLILTGIIFQVIPTIRSGLMFPYGMGFWGPNTHDGVWHIALINQLIKAIPPQNPIFAGAVLKNYHFFYDLLIAATAFFSKISVIDLVFRLYPILFSLLLGLGTYSLVKSLVKENAKYNFAIFFSLYFVYFTGSFGWIVDYLRQKTLGGESAFWANQSISFNLNPPFAISLIIVIAILQILSIKGKISSAIQIVLVSTLIGFKAYAAVLILLSLLTLGIFKRNLKFIFVSLISGGISFIYLISNFSIGKQLIVFSPFWFIHAMIDAPDRVGLSRLTLARTVGLETKNWFKFISAELIGLILFILGNLGMRIIGLLAFLKIRLITRDTLSLFLLIFSIFSLLIPILFIQSGNPWNTIQFAYYGLYIASIVSGIYLASFILKIPRIAAFLVILAVAILIPINSITTATYYLGDTPHGLISTKELEGLKFLSKQEDGIVLTYPYNENLKKIIAEPWPLFAYDSTAYVSAFSGKRVYLEDEGQNQILLTDYKKRLVASRDFFSNQGSKGKIFLEANKIGYIYTIKMFNISLDDKLLNIKNIFENDEIVIYKVN